MDISGARISPIRSDRRRLRFEDWTSVLGAERLTGVQLDRLGYHVKNLAMDGELLATPIRRPPSRRDRR